MNWTRFLGRWVGRWTISFDVAAPMRSETSRRNFVYPILAARKSRHRLSNPHCRNARGGGVFGDAIRRSPLPPFIDPRTALEFERRAAVRSRGDLNETASASRCQGPCSQPVLSQLASPPVH